VLLLLLVAACGGGDDESGAVVGFREVNPDGFNGAVLPEPGQLPDVTLTDSRGDDYSLPGDTTKPLTLVFFGYTHCPDICLVIMSDITAAVSRLPEDLRDEVGMVFVTSDPARDDPAALRAYLDRFNPDFEGLTGQLSEIKQVGKAVGVDIEKGDKLPSGGYAVAHGTQVVGVLPDGSAPLVWTQGTSSKDLAEDLTKALRDGVTPGAGQ
jgi:protein SCO1